MDKIIGRVAEKKELEEIFQSKEAEFVAVFGRRRVGKTYLIRNFFEAKKCTYFQMTGVYKGSLKTQLDQFAKEIGVSFYQGASIKSAVNWMDAFEELHNSMQKVAKNKKIVLFLDELPWMATKKSGVISALEYYWNRHWSHDARIKLIVCGSAASWIIKKIIKNRGGLHNRVTQKMILKPFSLNETLFFFKSMGHEYSVQQVCKIYMVIGGIPFYLKQIKRNASIDENINTLLFDPVGSLFNEFDEVFLSLFNHSDQFKELIKIIGTFQQGVSRSVLEAKSKLTSNGGRLTHRLEDLENTGFIKSFIPYGHKKLGLFYKLSDEYCHFYLKWIEPIKTVLKQGNTTKFWKKIVSTPEYYNWQGYAFENICYKHILQIRKALDLEDYSLASPWRYVPRTGTADKGAQIDLLFDRDNESITVCEMKYTESPFTIDKKYAEILKQKINVFKKITGTPKQIFMALISAKGIKQNKYSKSLVNHVVVLSDLFEQC